MNTWIPSAGVAALEHAPAAQLNLVKRIRWARRMKERFGTDYMQLNGNGRYTGLDGIALFYRDIAEKLCILPEMEEKIEKKMEEIRMLAKESLAYLGSKHCVLVCRGISDAPFTLKLFAKEFGVGIDALCVILTEEQRRSLNITKDIEEQLVERIREAAKLYAPQVRILLNPDRKQLQNCFDQADAVLGTGDFTLEGCGAPLIPIGTEMTSLSFESWLRNIKRLERRIRNAGRKDALLLNRMPFQEERYADYDSVSARAAREMWQRMWLEKKGE